MGIKSYLKSIPAVLSLKRKIWAYFYRPKSNQLLKDVHDILIQSGTLNLKGKDNNPLNRFGKKCFSQSDEDGISLEIIKRINLQSGTYAEFGVGDGLECNTLIFAALGWKGFWVGGQDLAFDYSKSKKFCYLKEWITLDNINSLVTAGLNKISSSAVDVVSLDLDGNDLYLIDALLVSGHRPKLFIVEYNGKFPPPIEFSIKYDPNHQWATDDYFGASLQSFVACFAKFGYRLICCNALTGTNAFFIRDDLMEHFSDVPIDIEDIYIPQRAVYVSKYSAGSSVRTVEQIINS